MKTPAGFAWRRFFFTPHGGKRARSNPRWHLAGKNSALKLPRIVFRIENASDGDPAWGVLAQPDQSTDGVVLTSVAFAKGELNCDPVGNGFVLSTA